jgi:hypothetical protein
MPASLITADPRCLMCGRAFPRGAGEARPKLTCSGGCKEHMRKVLAASPRHARRLLCERYPDAPRGHVTALLAYRSALAARRLTRAAVERAESRARVDRAPWLYPPGRFAPGR